MSAPRRWFPLLAMCLGTLLQVVALVGVWATVFGIPRLAAARAVGASQTQVDALLRSQLEYVLTIGIVSGVLTMSVALSLLRGAQTTPRVTVGTVFALTSFPVAIGVDLLIFGTQDLALKVWVVGALVAAAVIPAAFLQSTNRQVKANPRPVTADQSEVKTAQ